MKKKNILKIPQTVHNKCSTFPRQDIVAGCAQLYSADAIRNGALAHLQVELRDDALYYPERIVPPASQGKYSNRNIHGYEVVRNDLPIETRYHAVEAPNWGDSYHGTHTVWLPHRAYPKDFHPPRELEIILHCPDTSATRSSFIIAARVDEVLSQDSRDFEERLLAGLNLLQENFGACGIEPATTSVAEYARTLHLSWDILPPGSRNEVIQRLFKGRHPTQVQQDTAASRYDFFQSLSPQQIVIGSSGFRRYFGAQLENNLVIFENIQYGNAIYIMYENWEVLSQRSRVDLLSGRLGAQFDRVVHREGWQKEVRLLVEARRQNMKPQRRLW